MLEHCLERRRVAGSKEPEVARRDLEPGNVARAPHAEKIALQNREIAALRRLAIAPQSPGRVEHVEVRFFPERRWYAVEQPACFHDRQVERLAVVGHEAARAGNRVGDRREQRALGGVRRQQKLMDLESAEIEVAAADEKCDRSGAAAQSCRLDVQEDRAAGSVQRREIRDLTVADAQTAVPPVGFVAAADAQAASRRRIEGRPAERFAHPFERGRRPPAGAVQLVGQFAARLALSRGLSDGDARRRRPSVRSRGCQAPGSRACRGSARRQPWPAVPCSLRARRRTGNRIRTGSRRSGRACARAARRAWHTTAG